MSGTDFSDLPLLPMPFQASDQFFVARGGTSYRAFPHESINGANSLAAVSWASFQIRRPSGQSGGSFHPPNTWIERAFNYADPLNEFGSITPFPTAGRIELPTGRYLVSGWLTGMENAGMRCRLQPLGGSLPPLYSASTYSNHYSWHIPLTGLLAITESTQFVTEMRCDRERSKSWGFGYRTNVEPEIYGSLMFLRKD